MPAAVDKGMACFTSSRGGGMSDAYACITAIRPGNLIRPVAQALDRPHEGSATGVQVSLTPP